MRSRSMRREAIKRKKEMANHQTPINSSGPQGNGPAADNDDSSDHPLTDEDFSLSASMEAPPDPKHEPAVTDQDASVAPIEQQTVSESEQIEILAVVPLEVLEKSSASMEVGEKSVEGSSYSERTEIPVAIPRDATAAGPAPLLQRRASWWNCCGLLDAFGRSQR